MSAVCSWWCQRGASEQKTLKMTELDEKGRNGGSWSVPTSLSLLVACCVTPLPCGLLYDASWLKANESAVSR